MLIVTGTKRSGTSLWMQVLREAGCPIIGTAFPRTWRQHLEEENPGGFYESELRRGIYHATNPHPRTGRYLHPDDTRGHAVKVFVPGLVKSDHAFLGRVVASVRSWREVVVSLRRMRAREAVAFRWARATKPPMLIPPEVEWLAEVFNLVRDVAIRRYPALLVGHARFVKEPVQTLERVSGFLAPLLPPPVEPARLAQLVRGNLHRHVRPDVPDVVFDGDVARKLDDFVDAVDAWAWADPRVLEGLNEVWQHASSERWFDARVRWDDPRILGR